MSCLGSEIPSLVGGLGSKVLKCGAGSSLDLLSMAGGLFRIKSVLRRS